MVIPYFRLLLWLLPVRFGKSYRVRNQVVEMQLTKSIWVAVTKKDPNAERISASMNKLAETFN